MKIAFNICCILIASLLSQPQLGAQSTSVPATQPELTKLTLHASAATQPWVQTRLMMPMLDQHVGNAVPFYLLSFTRWPDEKTTDAVLEPENHKYDYLETPIEEFPPKYAKALLDAYADTLRYIELGAACREARWDDVWNSGWDGSAFGAGRFQYLSALRHAENLLGFRARLEIHQGRWPAALHTIQTEMAVAQHVGSERLVAHELVGNSFCEMALHRGVESWIAAGKSENLYWPLSVLPHPLISVNANDAGEDRALSSWRPVLTQAIKGTLPADQWDNALYEMVGTLSDVRGPYPHERDRSKILAEVDRLVKQKLDAGRQALKSAGATDTALNAMSPQQIVGMQLIHEYRTASANVWKSYGLAFPEAQAQMARAWKEINPQRSPAVDNPLIQSDLVSAGQPVDYSMPAALHRRYEMERSNRYLAILRCMEALRDYAAAHDGRPPERLDAIINLPVPLDPMTGRNFGYEVHGQVVILDATPPAPFGPTSGWRYELTFAK